MMGKVFNCFKVGKGDIHSLYVGLFELLLDDHSVNFLIHIRMKRSFGNYRSSLLMM